MQRLLIFLAILNYCSSKDWQCKKHDEDYCPSHTEHFYKLANNVISLEKRFENSCKEHMFRRPREIYNTESYALKYSLPELEANDLIIKVMYKAMSISPRNWESARTDSFWDLKILPDNLKPEEASWYLQDGELVITFPYRAPMGTEIQKSCGSITYAMIEVPMKYPKEDKETSTTDHIETK